MLKALLAVLALAVAAPLVAAPLPEAPAGQDADLRYFATDGTVLRGEEALDRMAAGPGLLAWVAGNQFFAMERVVHGFQARHPDTAVGLLTLPPGLLLRAIQAGGLRYQGRDHRLHPDVFGSVSPDHLKAAGVARYAVYMHNALQLLVVRGNPLRVRGLADLAREDLRVVLPNAIDEGIMTFYGKPLLQRQGLWARLSPGTDCADCDPLPHVHFCRIHHREIPARLRAGTSDVGLVWRTEAMEAARSGDLEGVALPAGEDARDQVAYVAGMLESAAHPAAAGAFMDYLLSPAGQADYAAFGFLPADAAERVLRPLP